MTEDRLVNCLSSFQNQCYYDVFLSFTGRDTRRAFTGHLYNALRQKGIHAFIDDEELTKGEEISPALPKAIGQSRISIIIFSENYASSSWCLDELDNIIQCEKKGQLVWPVFYKVDPSDVRHQKGSFGRAMAKHEQRFKGDPAKIQKWRLALTKAANLSGWHFTNGYEFKFIQQITEAISSILNRKHFHVADHPVGLESRISELTLQLGMSSNDVRMVGIYGLGGIGKTTLAKAMYNIIANQFDCASFLADVRESSLKGGLLQLQEAFLGEMLEEESIKLRNVDRGISVIRDRLHLKKVLLILDDVQKLEHLEKLAGGHDWFGSSSRIIITTRDKHLLIAHGVDILYEMKDLKDGESLELLSWHAFKSSKPKLGYENNACRAIRYANGLPLALKVIGCNLFNKGVDEWKCALDKYEKIPPNDIQNKLKISYDDLEENEKEIFLDMACFFRGDEFAYVERLLDACGFYPKYGIGVLVDKCLIKIEDNRVMMHDLIQEMGREIVTQSSRSNLNKRSRLWFYDDILKVLTNNMGTYKIEAIMMNPYERQEVQWSGEAFKKMPMLRMLVVRNVLFSMGPTYLPDSLKVLEWIEYPSSSLPEDFHPKKLVVMCLPANHLALFKPFQGFESLTYMDFRKCNFLTSLPDMSSIPCLTTLLLDECWNLIEIHDSVGFLGKIVNLSAHGCTELRGFPHEIRWTSLECLNLRYCFKLQSFPNILDKMGKTLYIDLYGTAIEDLPSSIGNLSGLQVLDMSCNKNLENLPSTIGMMTNITSISLQHCPQVAQLFKSNHNFGKLRNYFFKKVVLFSCDLSDGELPIVVHCFPSIEYLDLGDNKFVKVSTCIKELYHLKMLNLDFCELVEEIEGVPPNLVRLSTRNCNRLRLTSELANMRKQSPQVLSDHVPKCFNHYLGARKMSFWFRKKFPNLPLCLRFGMGIDAMVYFPRIMCDIHIHVNGSPFGKDSLVVGVSRGHVDFINLHSFIEERCILEEFGNFEWNHVEILFEPRHPYEIDDSNVRTYFHPILIFGKKLDTEDIQLEEVGPIADGVALPYTFHKNQSNWLTLSSTTKELDSILNEQRSTRSQGAGNDTTMTWDQIEMEANDASQRDQLVSNGLENQWPCSFYTLMSSIVTLCCPSSLNSP